MLWMNEVCHSEYRAKSRTWEYMSACKDMGQRELAYDCAHFFWRRRDFDFDSNSHGAVVQDVNNFETYLAALGPYRNYVIVSAAAI